MIYKEIKIYAESKKILITEIAEGLGMTSTGFKRSIDLQTLPISKVMQLCNYLGITPNEFFGYKNASKGGVEMGDVRELMRTITNLNDTIEEQKAKIAMLEGVKKVAG